MQNTKCRFCSNKKQCLYACNEVMSKGGNILETMRRSLYYKHGQSQNYFYSRPINQVLKKEKHTIYARVDDFNILDTSEEFLKQYYCMPNCQLQHKQLIRYYKFSIDHPTLYFIELKLIIQKYIARRSQVEYDWAMNQIEKETYKDGKDKSKKEKKKSTPHLRSEISCMLKELNESQKSMTILKLLKNVEPDHTVEKDWQKQFTQSLVEQDLAKAMQFSTFIQQIEQQKLTIHKKELMLQQQTIYLGNMKKQLHLQIGSPRKGSNIITNNFSIFGSTHSQIGNSNSTNTQNNPSTSSNKRTVSSNLQFFNNTNHVSNSNHNHLSQQHHNFIMKTCIVNNSNNNSIKPQATFKIQPLRIIEVPKLKIKFSHSDPKSERKYDKTKSKQIDCLTSRIKTQLDEPNSGRTSTNVRSIVIKRNLNHQQ